MKLFSNILRSLWHKPVLLRLRFRLVRGIKFNWCKIFDLKYQHHWNDWENLREATAAIDGENIELEKLKDWTPVTFSLTKERQTIAWMNLGQTSFTDPFFFDTVCRVLHTQPPPQPVFTNLNALLALHEIEPGLQPKGFIFHISKCGSTLFANMLAALPRNIVISMAEPIHWALMAPISMASTESLSDCFRMQLFHSTVGALGQQRLGIEENYIIRFEPYHVLWLPWIRKAFPNVPWIFLYRDPVEVMVSDILSTPFFVNFQREHPALVKQVLNLSALDLVRINPDQIYLAKQLLDFGALDLSRMSSEEFTAKAINSLCQIAIQQVDTNTLVVNYNQLLSKSCLYKLLDFFHIKASDAEIETMINELQFYSKDKQRKHRYKDDRPDKQAIAWQKIRDAVDEWAIDSYRKLEQLKVS